MVDLSLCFIVQSVDVIASLLLLRCLALVSGALKADVQGSVCTFYALQFDRSTNYDPFVPHWDGLGVRGMRTDKAEHMVLTARTKCSYIKSTSQTCSHPATTHTHTHKQYAITVRS
jgi:hypothetical protein